MLLLLKVFGIKILYIGSFQFVNTPLNPYNEIIFWMYNNMIVDMFDSRPFIEYVDI